MQYMYYVNVLITNQQQIIKFSVSGIFAGGKRLEHRSEVFLAERFFFYRERLIYLMYMQFYRVMSIYLLV